MNFPSIKHLYPLLLFLLFSTASFRTSFDTDFGWHMRTGETIVQEKRIPKTDTYSFTFPNKPYIYHSWMAEVVIYLFYSQAGLWGVSLLYALLIGGALILITHDSKMNKLEVLLFLSVVLSLSQLIGYRTQTFSGFFFALTYWLTKPETLTQTKQPSRRLLWLLPLFLVWANTHPGFLLGFPLVGFHVMVWLSNQKESVSVVLKTTAILLLSGIVTLINPHGYQLHIFLKDMMTNTAAKQFVFDWIPFFRLHTLSLDYKLMVILYFLVTMTVVKKKYSQRLLLLAFFFLLITSTRYTLPFTLILLSLIPTVLRHLSRWLKKQKGAYPQLLKVVLYSLIAGKSFFFCITLAQTYCANNSLACLEKKTPQEFRSPYRAVEHLKNQDFRDNILNDFNWGGYLIWQLPETKVFIDGRMDNFFMKDGSSFLKEYLSIVLTKSNWQQKLDQYGINKILLRPNLPIIDVLRHDPDWQLEFENESSVIFTRVNPTI